MDPALSCEYRVPSRELVDVVDARPTPLPWLHPGNEWLLLMEPWGLPPISELAQPELRLAGIRFLPRTTERSLTGHYRGLSLVRIRDGKSFPIDGLPEDSRISSPRWSLDGERMAFLLEQEEGLELWVAEISTRRCRRVLGPRISMVAGARPHWLPDGSLLALLVPENRGTEPRPARVPSGPVVQESRGRVAAARTFQDLLRNVHDESLFEYHALSVLARISLQGDVEIIGGDDLYWGYEPSPDGRYLLVVTLHRPFSYQVPESRFPRRVRILTTRGEAVRELVDRPLQEEIPLTFSSVVSGARSFQWRADADASVCWVEALDGGDAGRPAELRDELRLLEAPFEGESVCLARLPYRYGGVVWGHDDLALVSSWWWETRWLQTLRIRPGACLSGQRPEEASSILYERSWEDRYGAPGSPELKRNARGRLDLLTMDGGNVLTFMGDGASPEGDRPFLDRLDLRTGETRRLLHSEPPCFEEPVVTIDPEADLILVRREAVDVVPNYWIRSLRTGELRQITFFPHPAPGLRGFRKETLRYERRDGVKLSGTLYLPPGYETEHGPLPTILWAYPQEYKSADAAGQLRDSPHRFDLPSWTSPLLWLLRGYAVLDDPGMPIVGEGDSQPNETFIEQLVANAEAAVNALVSREVCDPRAVAIGGHSYGAFMTAHLLSHSRLFAAGIARSGAYNRTLTPFGFQSEERTLWQAPETYVQMSPLLHADKLHAPILLIHGEADANTGTHTMQSERYYSALVGHGSTVRLVILPHESHSYRARESILHVLWETEQWLETHVRPGRDRGEDTVSQA
jgi:dipeptidyl aminopeptidase/acylaminoacyl peptidase